MITDTHCHLTCDQLYDQADDLIQDALDAGVDLMMVVCTNKEEYDRALILKRKYPEIIKVAFGWYPGDAQEVGENELAVLEEAAASGNMDVLGEIGLDYYWDSSFKDVQKDLFKKQIEMANKYNLPIAIHMREASRDTMDLLEENAKTPVILHCFSGSEPIMKEALKQGYYISFAGPITYKNNKQGPINVKACPADRILSETDSPYLTPVPYRGKPNQPAYVKKTVEKMAELKDMDPETLQKQIRANYLSILENKKS